MSLLDVVVPGAGSAVQAVTKILTLCQQMKEGQDACTRVHARLQTVLGELQRLEARKQLPPSEAVVVYADVLTRYLQYLERYRAKPLASRLIRHARMMDELRQFHEDVDTLFQLLQLAVAGTVVEWKSQWEVDRQAQKHMLAAVVDNDAMILHELRDLRAQMEAMTLLQFELKRRPTPSAPELDDEPNRDHDTELMRRMFKTVVRTSRGSAPIVPPWFLPPDDVAFDPIPFARGSFATVHRGTWGFGTRVVIKRLLVDDSRAGELLPPRFEKEVSLWHTLNHPNVVKMFGASHVSWPPFIVCEDAVGGNLSSYLTRSPSVKQRSMWRLLYEAALGLDYLHRSRVVHGDLKLNNLLVGADGQAKIADFGLSAVRNTLSTSSTAGAGSRGPQSGGLRWRAPECLRRAPTFASDVYSFAMCLIEAVTDEPPFAFLDDESVRENLRHGDIPDQPDDMPQDAWALVLAMTCFEPKERIPMSRVLSKLKIFAEREAQERATANSSATCSCCGTSLTNLNNTDSSMCSNCGKLVDRNELAALPLPHNEKVHLNQNDSSNSADLAVEQSSSIKRLSAVETFMDHLRATDDEFQLAQGVRELLFWLIEAVDERGRLELEAQTDAADLVLDHLLRTSDYIEEMLGLTALAQMINVGYRVASERLEQFNESIKPANLDLSFVVSGLSRDVDHDERRNALVLCGSLVCVRNDNNEALIRAGAVPALASIITQQDGELKEYAAFALGCLAGSGIQVAEMAQSQVIASLVSQATHGSPALRAWAAFALAYLAKSAEVRHVMQELRAEESLRILLANGAGLEQQWAAFAIGQLVEYSNLEHSVAVAKDALPDLIRLVKKGDNGQKIWAMTALHMLANRKGTHVRFAHLVVSPLVALLRTDIAYQQLWAVNLISKLTDDSSGNRKLFAQAGAISMLVTIAKDGSVEINKHLAIEALGKLATENQSNSDAIISSGVVAVLADVVRYESALNQFAAARTLGSIAASASDQQIDALAAASVVDPLVSLLRSSTAPDLLKAEATRALGTLAHRHSPTRTVLTASDVVQILEAAEATLPASEPLAKWATYSLDVLLDPSKTESQLR